MRQLLYFILVFQFSILSLADHPYYGEEFYKRIPSEMSSEEISQLIKKVLKSGHIRNKQGHDTIVESCNSQKDCYQHISLGYREARRLLMGEMYLVKQKDSFGVQEVYCSKVYNENEFGSEKPGPGLIPNNTVVNCEHTWPQSRFNGRMDKEMQKSDLHHLFPTDSLMNSTRGNYKLGEVQGNSEELKCPNSKFGRSQFSNNPVFEPPTEHKGNAARALFYFSIRYDLPIDEVEEAFLKKWHLADPVDQDEIDRHEEIYKAQGNRNPFIDHPELVSRIENF